MVGTWRFVERTEGPSTPGGDVVVLKHITPTNFVVMRMDSKGAIDSTHGGPVRVDGGKLTETVDHFSAHERYASLERGASITFQCAIDGDALRIRGAYRDQTMAEHWRRVSGSSAGAGR